MHIFINILIPSPALPMISSDNRLRNKSIKAIDGCPFLQLSEQVRANTKTEPARKGRTFPIAGTLTDS